MKGLVIVGILALMYALPTAPAYGSPDSAPSSLRQQDLNNTIKAGNAYLDDEGLFANMLVDQLDKAIESPDFATMPEETRYGALLIAGQLAYQNDDLQKSYRLLVTASESRLAETEVWHALLASAFDLKKYSDSARCVTVIARHFPDSLERINDRAVYMIEDGLEDVPGKSGERQEFLQALFDANWSDLDGNADILWRHLATTLLGKGKRRQAIEVAGRIRSARVAISMLIDKRFDRITRHHRDGFNIDRIAESELTAARARAESMPDVIRPKSVLMGILIDRLQFDAALVVADEVIARVRGVDGSSLYEDFDEQYIWVLDQRARALARLGRWDDAIVQWSQTARRPENGDMNVSQIINLADFYNSVKRPKDAADMVAELGSMSAFGRMQLAGVKLEAALQLGDKASVADQLAYLREHREDAIGTWQYSLLRVGDLDGASDLLLERLQNPKWRNEALVELQDYTQAVKPPRDAEYDVALSKLIARPEVAKALAKIGRIEHFKLKSPES
jgi:hypothetical protein